jgi:hypothetical protein
MGVLRSGSPLRLLSTSSERFRHERAGGVLGSLSQSDIPFVDVLGRNVTFQLGAPSVLFPASSCVNAGKLGARHGSVERLASMG